MITAHDGSITAVIRHQTKRHQEDGQGSGGGGRGRPRGSRSVRGRLDGVSAESTGNRSERVQRAEAWTTITMASCLVSGNSRLVLPYVPYGFFFYPSLFLDFLLIVYFEID